MTAESLLSSVVEIGVGMAGFAGIIAAIRQRDVSTWDPHQRVLLQMLFTASAAAVMFSLLPAVLTEAGLAPHRVWSAGSGALIAWFILAPAYRYYQTRQPGVKFTIARPVMALLLPVLPLLVWNLFTGVSWPYLVGVVMILVNGFATFLGLLFGKTGSKPAEP